MAYHTTPPKKVKKQGEMPLPSLSPIPLKNVEVRDGIGPRLGNGISHCSGKSEASGQHALPLTQRRQ